MPDDLNPTDTLGLKRVLEVAWDAKNTGNLPFGAVLFTADGAEFDTAYNTVLESGDQTAHAETALVRQVSPHLSRAELEASTMYASCEPCAMCAGAIFSAGIGRVLFALSADRCRELVEQSGEPRLPSLLLRTAEVLAHGEVPTEVRGGFMPKDAEAFFVSTAPGS